MLERATWLFPYGLSAVFLLLNIEQNCIGAAYECLGAKTGKENSILCMAPDNDHGFFFSSNFAIHAGTETA